MDFIFFALVPFCLSPNERLLASSLCMGMKNARNFQEERIAFACITAVIIQLTVEDRELEGKAMVAHVFELKHPSRYASNINFPKTAAITGPDTLGCVGVDGVHPDPRAIPDRSPIVPSRINHLYPRDSAA